MFSSKHFTLSEFQCKGNDGCPTMEPNPLLVEKLDKLRDILGEPLVITSGIRCAAYNAKVGGVNDSAHNRGDAADIMCSDSTARYLLLHMSCHLFQRIGVGKGFIHVDVSTDPAHAQNVLWTYYP